jgi:hypothetical protein
VDREVLQRFPSKPTANKFKEYPFTFKKEQLAELEAISNASTKSFLALVCVKDRGICCIAYGQLKELIERRKKAKGGPEDQYTVLVTISKGKAFRAYVNAPGQKKTILEKELVVARNAFPNSIFI